MTTAHATRRTIEAAARGVPVVAPGPSHWDFLSARRAFADGFPDVPFLVPHHLPQDARCQMDAILELCKRLPASQMEFNLGDLPVHLEGKAPGNGLSAAETIEQIATCKSWIALRNIEKDPAGQELLHEVQDEIFEHVRRLDSHSGALHDVHQREGYFFVTSPGSVTPVHIDPEHNFLIQLQGTKTVHVWSADDKQVLPDEKLEELYTTRTWAGVRVRVDGVPPTWSFVLRPGDALHLPLELPHWVECGREVSVSMSTTWRSALSKRKQAIHQFNAKLRRLGLRPTSVGASTWRDAAKWQVMRAARAVKRALGR